MAKIISPAERYSPLPDMPDHYWQKIVSLASKHGVTAYLHGVLKDKKKVPPSVLKDLRALYAPLWRDSILMYGVFSSLADLFRDEKLEFMLLKGFHVAERVYGGLKKRPMQDIDILVRKEDAERADRILSEFASPERWNRTWIEKHGYHMGYLKPVCTGRQEKAVKIELHWNILPPESPFCFSTEDIWEKAQTMRISKKEIKVMSKEHLLLYLCLHLSFQHIFCLKLIHLLDIAIIIHTGDFSWDKFAELSVKTASTRAVCAVFGAVERVFGLKLNSYITEEIKEKDYYGKIVENALVLIEDDPVILHSAFSRMGKHKGAAKKTSSLFFSFFPKPSDLKALHGAESFFPDVILAYIYRMKELFIKYGAIAFELVADEKKFRKYRRHSKTRKRILSWISEKN
ncbi:nucleotidyltransferase family protein [candidate division WOR-3 bacterium]|nr:nucleotidyltransferase family protein [candidate division WOR-3 bacterium]